MSRLLLGSMIDNRSIQVMETGLNREKIVGELNRSAHGKYSEYVPVFSKACELDPEFLAKLIAWDFTHGQIKDLKVAMPVISLASREFPDELVENSLAHLALQPPRELLKAVRFAIEIHTPNRRMKRLRGLVNRYLESKETPFGKWTALALRHRSSLRSLYAFAHRSCGVEVSRVLFGTIFKKKAPYLPGTVWHDIANLSRMDPKQAAAVIQKYHLSPLVVDGAMTGSKHQEASVVVQAGLDQMTGTEAVTRSRALDRKGVGKDEVLKEKYRKKAADSVKSGKATLKTGHKAEEVEDEGMKAILKELQERQIEAQKQAGKGIDGNWLIIADCSQSQEAAIELGKHIAAAVAKFVTGRVWLVFCNTAPQGTEVTGLSLDQIKEGTKWVRANGSTSYGVGLQWYMNNHNEVDGICIVGDGGENAVPLFRDQLLALKKNTGKDVPVYLYQTYVEPRYAATPGGDPGNFARLMAGAVMSPIGVRDARYGTVAQPQAFTTFDLTHGKVDYYSIPNLVQTMKANRWGLTDQIMATPLLTVAQVLHGTLAAAR